MKVFTITYKNYDGIKTFTVGARSFLAAYERAKAWTKKKHYSEKEIVAIEKVMDVDVVAK